MPEQLSPIRWKVWLRSDPSKFGHCVRVTRLEAMLVGAAKLKGARDSGDVDREVVRELAAVSEVAA